MRLRARPTLVIKTTRTSILPIALLISLLAASSGTHAQPSPTYVYEEGTIFLFPDTITPKDPTSFSALSDVPTTETVYMWDRSTGRADATSAFIFLLTYDDQIEAKVRVRKADYSTEETARSIALEYAELMGRLPAFLRNAVEKIDIMKGDEAWGGSSNDKALALQIGSTSERYKTDKIREETLVHEACHAFFPDASHESSEWQSAKDDDPKFISKYASENPNREDFPESFVPYLAAQYRRDRIPYEDAEKIENNIADRMHYFETQGFDLYPLVARDSFEGGWTKIGAFGQRLAVSGGDLYAITWDGAVWKYRSADDWTRIGAHARQLAASGEKLYSITHDGVIWKYNNSPKDWTRIGAHGRQLAASGDNLYAITRDGVIWKYESAQDWTRIGGHGQQLTANGSELYSITRDGAIWKYKSGKEWTRIGGYGQQLAASGEGLYSITYDGAVWKYNGGKDWTRIGSNGKRFVASGEDLYVITRNGAIARYSGSGD